MFVQTPQQYFDAQDTYWEGMLNGLAARYSRRPFNDIVRMKFRQDVQSIIDDAKRKGQEPALKRALARRGIK